MNSWNIDDAQTYFGTVLSASKSKPQIMRNGSDKAVAVVVNVELFRELLRLKPDLPNAKTLTEELGDEWAEQRKSMAELMAELEVINREETAELEIPPRVDRPNPMFEEES